MDISCERYLLFSSTRDMTDVDDVIHEGIWLRPTPLSHPNLTLFGSTNLNSRSSNLDTELSFMMVTTSPLLRKRLGEEVEGLREDSGAWRGGERNVRIGTRILVGLVGNML